MDHEGLREPSSGAEQGVKGRVNRKLIGLLGTGRRFRLPDGSGVILGRNAEENGVLAKSGGTVVEPPTGVPGPVALVPDLKSEADLGIVRQIVRAWSRGTSDRDRDPYKKFQIV